MFWTPFAIFTHFPAERIPVGFQLDSSGIPLISSCDSVGIPRIPWTVLGLGLGSREGSSGKSDCSATNPSREDPRIWMEQALHRAHAPKRTWRKTSAWRSGRRLKRKSRKMGEKGGDLEGENGRGLEGFLFREKEWMED